MSYNGSGTFNINSAGQPVVTGTVISSTSFNALTADLATGLTTALTKDGQTTPTANIKLGTYKLTGVGAGTTANDALVWGQTASININGTVGATTPAAGAFTTLSATGNITSTGQPAFLACSTSGQVNSTGNGTVVTVSLGTEIFDQGNNFASNTFTAPIAGKYQFDASVYLQGMTGATDCTVQIVSSNRTYTRTLRVLYGSDAGQNIGALVDMDAADTVQFKISVNGLGGLTASIYGDGSPYTYMSGFLAC